MDDVFLTDEGHFMDIDDLTQYAKWKTEELIKDGYGIESIMGFYDHDEWARIVRFFIK